MFGYTLPNIIIVLSLAGIVALLARRVGEAEKSLENSSESAKKVSRFDWIRQGWLRKASRFLLEAKGLYHPEGSKLRLQHLLSSQKQEQGAAQGRRLPEKHVEVKLRQDRPKVAAASPKVSSSEAKPKTATTKSAIKTTPAEKPAEKNQVLKGRGPTVSPKPLKLLKEAKSLLDSKQYARARKILQDIAPSFMDEPNVWAKLGFAQYQLEDYTGAVHSYSYALALDSNQPNRYYNLSLAYLALGDHASALKNIDKALVLDESEKYQKTKDYIVKAGAKSV